MSLEKAKQENGEMQCVCGKKWELSTRRRRGGLDVGAIKPFFAFFTHVCEYAQKITSIDFDVAEHIGST